MLIWIFNFRWFEHLLIFMLCDQRKSIYIYIYIYMCILNVELCKIYNLYYSAGLCQGCVLGTFSTLKSGMSPIILAEGAHDPRNLRFTNGNITLVTPEKLPMSPYFSMVWVICPHFFTALAEHCILSCSNPKMDHSGAILQSWLSVNIS